MAPQIPPLDEQEFDQPALIGGLPDQDLDRHNNIFWYFTSSPWFDPRSLNIAVFHNCQLQPDGQQIMNDRKLWDERLRDVPQGFQFMTVAEPQGEGQPWVVQRQNKIYGDNGTIETHVEGNWYTQGTKVLMAPSLLDVVQNRLLTISTRMQQLADISKGMSHWSPSTGYSNYPPSYETKQATTVSRVGSPSLGATEPEAFASQSQGQGATGSAQTADTAAASTEEFSDALFLQSLNLTNAYGNEFMDENPLKGEPGAFVFENTQGAVDARNKAQEQAAQASQPAVPTPLLKIDTSTPSVVPSAIPTPKGAATPAGPEAHSRKGSVAPASKRDKKKRKQSIAGLASPTTPAPTPGPTPAPSH
ncbi:Mediator of RNA polymerase II transcription subunit 6 [Coniothyrium glycines]